jgi:glycosyltransferase involved in cell wall biosynthesis
LARPAEASILRVGMADMRLAAVSRVKNECDIIESFVRHNLAFLDRLYIVDNHSSDGTEAILQKLAAEGLPISLSTDDEVPFYQSRQITGLIKQAIADESWDFIFPLDGDEFLQVRDRAVLEGDIAPLGREPGQPGLMYMVNYVPTENDDRSEPDFLRRIRHRPEFSENPVLGKVVVPAIVARQPSFAVSEGCHFIRLDGQGVSPIPLARTRMAHFPVRSLEQFTSRVVVNYIGWISRTDYKDRWVPQVRDPYQQLKQGASLTASDLTKAALGYALLHQPPTPAGRRMTLVRDPFKPAYDRLRYADLVKVDVFPRILEAAEQMALELRETQAQRDEAHRRPPPAPA